MQYNDHAIVYATAGTLEMVYLTKLDHQVKKTCFDLLYRQMDRWIEREREREREREFGLF